MKKSKCVGIGLLALSVASCNNTPKQPKHDMYNPDSLAAANYYIREGENINFYPGDYNYPIWIYEDYYYSPRYGYVTRPGVIYHTTQRTTSGRVATRSSSRFSSRTSPARSSFQSSSAGRSFGVSRGAVSRGGFGGSFSSAS